jgi:thiosulfate/3-mercaptopyruvate sulfurtransferase
MSADGDAAPTAARPAASAQPWAQPPAALLIGVESLAAELAGAQPPVVLDVRWRLGGPPGIDSYRAGHLPGAVFVDLDSDLSGPKGAGGRHPLPSPADFEAAMRLAGVRAGQPVVVYDDGDSTIAARAWWTLRYFGHDQVRVLDGGFRAWAAAGHPVTVDEPSVAAGDFTAVPGHLPVLDAAGAGALARSGVLLDARAGERYRGETEPVDPVAGHIPGALNAPTAANVGPDGRFRPPAELRERFTGLGIAIGPPGSPDPPGPPGAPAVGAYCGSGVTAAHEVLALALAGVPAGLYVGSWSGWTADPSRPVATGPAPG